MSRPLIAIPSRFSEHASALRYRAEVGSANLLAAVYAAGGEPLLVHPVAPDAEVSDAEVAERLAWADGVLLPGGGDLAAHWSGQSPHPSLYDVDPEQDAFDLATARVAVAAGRPLLAICRGLQVVNVALGGTLVQQMSEGLGRDHRNHIHTITPQPGTLAARILGGSVEASCFHHQSLARLGDGLVVTARSEDDVIESVELPSATGWFFGVQWHPEDNWRAQRGQLGVLEAFVAASSVGRAFLGRSDD
jgi:putative glutamine amidotransferase